MTFAIPTTGPAYGRRDADIEEKALWVLGPGMRVESG